MAGQKMKTKAKNNQLDGKIVMNNFIRFYNLEQYLFSIL